MFLSVVWLALVAVSHGSSELDCGLRTLASRFAPVWPHRRQDLLDALELDAKCGAAAPIVREALTEADLSRLENNFLVKNLRDVLTDEVRVMEADGVMEDETLADDGCEKFAVDEENTVEMAVEKSRLSKAACRVVEVPEGVTFLRKTLEIGPRDKGLVLRGKSGESWLSGGKEIEVREVKEVWVKGAGGEKLRKVEVRVAEEVGEVEGLFGLSPHNRFQAARWPNGNTETDQWGYASPLSGKVSVGAAEVREWVQPNAGEPARFTVVDLREEGNPTGFVKRDSLMKEYNQYSSGSGGKCDEVWDTSYSESYWCGNASGGGWAEVDREFATAGTVGLPVGLGYYRNGSAAGERIQRWSDAAGAVVHAWHGQSWFTNAWVVKRHDREKNVLEFVEGGSQGGRNWCRCDQCGYAGPWCRKGTQKEKEKDRRLVSGTWYVENVEEELDKGGEFFFVRENRTLVILLNETETIPKWLVVPKLETLVAVGETERVRIEMVGFRDAARTHLKKHGVPSGGDWALYKGAALTIANSSDVVVDKCVFSRLDGNGVILLGRTRRVEITGSEFSWLGASAMAAWGQTDGWDGRNGMQPRGTVVKNNVVREIGIYQKQSSAWFQAKACDTEIVDNVFFNLPRAAVNFNDGFGGNNLVMGNLMFNTCRESGDHGAINSWDRQPFLWDETGRYGFDTPPSFIQKNFIIANYGASQGVDNDDGSSFYHIIDNVFYGDGFKMDYGGHDSKFQKNLVIVRPYDGQNCFNVDRFFPGHSHEYSQNVCVILGCRGDCENRVGTLYSSCSDPYGIRLFQNQYFTKGNNATIRCDNADHLVSSFAKTFQKEQGSTVGPLPSDAQLVEWMERKIHSWEAKPK